MCTLCADWPDYERESDSETGSETEMIVAGGSSSGGTLNQSDLGGLVVQPSHSSSMSSHWELEASAPPVNSPSSNIPFAVGSQTAQRIMYLLDEIGTSNLVDRPPHDSVRFLHCVHCSGRLIVL